MAFLGASTSKFLKRLSGSISTVDYSFELYESLVIDIIPSSVLSYYRLKHADWADEATQDALNMRKGVDELKANTAFDQVGYYYANKRFAIPFGWNANRVLNTASGVWVYFVDNDLDPFVLPGFSSPVATSNSCFSGKASAFNKNNNLLTFFFI